MTVPFSGVKKVAASSWGRAGRLQSAGIERGSDGANRFETGPSSVMNDGVGCDFAVCR